MGVTGLWTVVQPCARPIKLETLNRKRLAVDASIWIYQFLKAVRDKEGNALRNSHVVGFFRRICKLLFIGIKPVFVFDGGAPALKRQTVVARKSRREGRREDAVRTAGKLLAVQMQRRAGEIEERKREDTERSFGTRRPAQHEEEEITSTENLVYAEEAFMTPQERAQSRNFKKKDAYHLPNLDVNLSDMGAPNDPRIMSHEELEEYARQFHSGEDVNLYDFSKIDFESPFFQSLPAADRYNILNAARLRSRLRMGYSKDQLDTMFPNRMDFSRFQIERVKERNELTQRLMNLNGMNDDNAMAAFNQGGRVAGEKGKEYVLVKNDGVEGGWALGVVSNKEGQQSKPIDVERFDRKVDEPEEVEEDEEDGFEDVPIEGLNRLPKRRRPPPSNVFPLDSEELESQRRAVYEARSHRAGRKAQTQTEEGDSRMDVDSLFVQQPAKDLEGSAMPGDAEATDQASAAHDTDEEDLQKAIALSLQKDGSDAEEQVEDNFSTFASLDVAGPRIDRPLAFNAKNAKSGRAIAQFANAKAMKPATGPFAEESDEDPPPTHTTSQDHRKQKAHEPSRTLPSELAEGFEQKTTPSGFDGPLPFESISLGKSILRGKRRKEDEAGGFEKDTVRKEKEKPKPLPPWFSGDIRDAAAKQKAIEEQQFEGAEPRLDKTESRVLQRRDTVDVVDVDAIEQQPTEPIAVESSDDEDGDVSLVETGQNQGQLLVEARDASSEQEVTHETTVTTKVPSPILEGPAEASDPRDTDKRKPEATEQKNNQGMNDDEEEPIDWSESEEEVAAVGKQLVENAANGSSSVQQEASREKTSSPEFEDVEIPARNPEKRDPTPPNDEPSRSPPPLPHEDSTNIQVFEDLTAEAEELYSDPEDEDLFRQLATEAEEHARFASSLNSKSYQQNADEYERELRQLRNQQKKDRRDADEVSHIMVTECQQLLRLFGLPYVTAPMEAEAQCAELVSLGLVDGIVTDDSDIFLFGGTRVYKNVFNQAKFVECYLTSDLEKEYGLTREKMIRLAHLLGSDYTEGLPSVGPVTALEILSEFGTLEKFAEWWTGVQMAEKASAEDTANPFRRKFRKNAAKIFLPTTFPDLRVNQAYLQPEVDHDPQPFQWGVPNLDALRQFLMATIGWSQERTDEVLVPVIRDMNQRDQEGTQANITQFFSGGVGVGAKTATGNANGTAARSNGEQAFAPRRRAEGKSKRMEHALDKLHSQAQGRAEDAHAATPEADGTDAPRNKQKQGAGKRNTAQKQVEEADTETDGSNEDGDYTEGGAARKKRKSKTSTRQRAKRTHVAA